MGSVGRRLVLVLLGLAVAGFGVCSLCGGIIGLTTLAENSRGSRDIAVFAFTCSAIGAAIAVGAWYAFRAVRRRG